MVASFLAYETKGLLLGESARPEILEQIDRILKAHNEIIRWNAPKSVHFGPQNVLLVLELELKDELGLHEAEALVKRLDQKILKAVPQIQQVFIQTIYDLSYRL